MTDWSEYADAGKPVDLKSIRARLPIGYVLAKYGFSLENLDGRLVSLCPFHDDTKPSFDVFGENLEFFGCYPCFGENAGGDVNDLIQRLENTDYRGGFQKALALLTELDEEGWDGPRTGRKQAPINTVKALQKVKRSFSEVNWDLLDAFCRFKGYPFTPQWLHEMFWVGNWADKIVVPFFNPFVTADEGLVGYKERSLSSHPFAAAGSDFSETFYNHWRWDEERPIILCEGESDVWVTHHAVGVEYLVLGIPTGAGGEKIDDTKEPKQAHLIHNRKVILAFDGDDAGRAARVRWFNALEKNECEVFIAPVPEGKDMATVDDPKQIIEQSVRTILAKPSGIRATPNGYVKPTTKEDQPDSPMSNWTFTPTRELVGTDGVAYEGTIEPGRQEDVISSFDLKNKTTAVGWSITHRRSWYGSERDAQLLLGLLQSEGPFLSSGKMATVAGLHDKHFIWPGGKVGPDYWKYVKPAADVHLESSIHIEQMGWDPSYVHELRKLHSREVMDPLLAWLFAAPVRSQLREFPTLSITGSSGTGKTTLPETLVPLVSGADISNNLTSTTRYAIFAHIASTNAFPVRFDEYRPGARKDAISTIEQLIRDAYTMQPSSTGGMRGHWAEVTTIPTSAPLIVSGEDSYSETSLTERSVLLHLPMEGRNPEQLRKIRAIGQTGLPYAYLNYLHDGFENGTLPEISNRQTGDTDLPPRQRLNMGVLELGWDLLTAFMEHHGESISAPDFSLVVREAKEAMKHAPIEDALQWCLGEPDASTFIFMTQINGAEFLCVRVENFVHYVNRQGTFTLPGGVTAVRKHLMMKYQASEQIVTLYGAQKRVLAISSNALNLR